MHLSTIADCGVDLAAARRHSTQQHGLDASEAGDSPRLRLGTAIVVVVVVDMDIMCLAARCYHLLMLLLLFAVLTAQDL
ncbi:hypothetical protein ACLKA6_001472 [Drosophila palustris]